MIIDKELMKPSIFGMFDGLTTLLGVFIPLLSYTHLLVFFTCIGLAVSSSLSMGLGDYLSSDKDLSKRLRLKSAVYMALFTGFGCLVPVIPFAFIGGLPSLVVSLAIYLALTFVVAYMKSADMGWKESLQQTFTVTALAVIIVVAVTLLLPIPAA